MKKISPFGTGEEGFTNSLAVTRVNVLPASTFCYTVDKYISESNDLITNTYCQNSVAGSTTAADVLPAYDKLLPAVVGFIPPTKVMLSTVILLL